MTRTPPRVLGEFEQIVMLALLRLGSDADAVAHSLNDLEPLGAP
jgi:hypothetical protein